MSILHLCMRNHSLKYIYQIAGPALAIAVWMFSELDPARPQVTLMAGVAVWMCVWWFSEAVSLAITALIPVLFLPILGIADVKSVAQQYSDSIIFLFLVRVVCCLILLFVTYVFSFIY